tara:strand:- start:84 stop:254 length:171 start_codon:yes stop_codon:yes gene_type:complete
MLYEGIAGTEIRERFALRGFQERINLFWVSNAWALLVWGSRNGEWCGKGDLNPHAL